VAFIIAEMAVRLLDGRELLMVNSSPQSKNTIFIQKKHAGGVLLFTVFSLPYSIEHSS